MRRTSYLRKHGNGHEVLCNSTNCFLLSAPLRGGEGRLIFDRLKTSRGKHQEKDAGDVVLTAALFGYIDEIGAGRVERRGIQDGRDFVLLNVAGESIRGQEDPGAWG